VPKIIKECCELVNFCNINCSGSFFRHSVLTHVTVIATVHPLDLMNVEQCSVAVGPQTKPTN